MISLHGSCWSGRHDLSLGEIQTFYVRLLAVVILYLLKSCPTSDMYNDATSAASQTSTKVLRSPSFIFDKIYPDDMLIDIIAFHMMTHDAR